jgi:hypothetical protein
MASSSASAMLGEVAYSIWSTRRWIDDRDFDEA